MSLHDWTLTPQAARNLQRSLAGQLDNRTPIDLDGITTVAGVDVSVRDNISRAAIVILDFPLMEIVESVTASMPTPFPYVPGLLSFREGQVILDAHAKLQHRPEVYLFDGAGIAHPRRIGIAAHMGLWFDAPTVGCAKTYLIGAYDAVGEAKGDYSLLTDKTSGDEMGVVLRTRARVKPMFISPGHKATIDSDREVVMRCVGKYRLPEPIRAAHVTAGKWSG